MEQPPQNVTVLDGKDATIICRAVAAPTPNITWIYNGELTLLVLVVFFFCFFFFHIFSNIQLKRHISFLVFIFY